MSTLSATAFSRGSRDWFFVPISTLSTQSNNYDLRHASCEEHLLFAAARHCRRPQPLIWPMNTGASNRATRTVLRGGDRGKEKHSHSANRIEDMRAEIAEQTSADSQITALHQAEFSARSVGVISREAVCRKNRRDDYRHRGSDRQWARHAPSRRSGGREAAHRTEAHNETRHVS
jgi:hypothetical protein